MQGTFLKEKEAAGVSFRSIYLSHSLRLTLAHPYRAEALLAKVRSQDQVILSQCIDTLVAHLLMVSESVVAASVVNKVAAGTLMALASVASKAAILYAVQETDTSVTGTSVAALLVAVLVAGTSDDPIAAATSDINTQVDTHPLALDLLQVTLVPLDLFSFQILSVSTTLLAAIYFISSLDGTFGLTLEGQALECGC